MAGYNVRHKTWFCDHLEEKHLSAYLTIFTPHTTKAMFTIMALQAQKNNRFLMYEIDSL